MWLRFILALLLALVPPALAQVRGAFHSSAHSAHSFASSSARHRSAFPRGYFVGDTPFFYDDYPFDLARPDAVAPSLITQAPAETLAAKAPPLLIELQGDRYVRYGGVAQTPEREMRASGASAANNSKSSLPAQLSTDPDLVPSVLVYRDGHREEVPDYAIVGAVMYAHRDHEGQAAYGMKTVPLSALDIPATMKANRDNGVSFVLPSGPNEVVTRP